jgi:hypothetical protein
MMVAAGATVQGVAAEVAGSRGMRFNVSYDLRDVQ